MGVKVAVTCLHWSQSVVVPHSPTSSSSQTLASISSSKRRRSLTSSFTVTTTRRHNRSGLFGSELIRTHSFQAPNPIARPVRRTCSVGSDSFNFDLPNHDDDNAVNSGDVDSSSSNSFSVDPPWTEEQPPDWCEIERKANSVELPISLRILKRKLKWINGFREAGETACCSVKKAFSSMVFIIREIQSFTLQMREILFYEDLQGILVRVQKEMHMSFVWLFQQVFSHTPTLMVYVMILLANFTVHSMASNTAIASPPPTATTTTSLSAYHSTVKIDDKTKKFNFDSSSVKTFSISNGKTTSIGGGNGGGGKIRPVSSGTDGDGSSGSDRVDQFKRYVPDGSGIGTQLSSIRSSSTPTESVTEEVRLWNSFVNEASNMQDLIRDGTLDHETMKRFVSPILVKIEADDYIDYFRTELLYRSVLLQEPNNSLLLANFAQFLYLVEHDYDRY